MCILMFSQLCPGVETVLLPRVATFPCLQNHGYLQGTCGVSTGKPGSAQDALLALVLLDCTVLWSWSVFAHIQ